MVFAADDLGAWLVTVLADAGRRWLTTFVLGTDQERALMQAATAAVGLTAAELHPENGERAENLARVVDHVFSARVPELPPSGRGTLLEGLQAGIAGQLAVLDDAGLTGTGLSSADVLEVPGTGLAEKLTAHLLREIMVRGSRGGPLFPLASQLNDDMTHLQGQQLQGLVGELAEEVREALSRLDDTRTAAAPLALAQLPPMVAGFTGRDDELAVLAGLLDPTGAAGPVVVSAVAGLAGVGKTTLAVEAGHAALRYGWYSGGVLFIDLHGYDEAPVEPSQALVVLLRALGVPAEHIPPGADERAGLYRSVLAEISDPVLVIADNVSSEAQVRPLLSGIGPHKVLVTSRRTLAGLGARLMDVTVLDEAAGVELLDMALRAARPEDDRITRDLQAASRLAGICGGLPLALHITAALLIADPARSAADLADELALESVRLEQLAYDDGSGTSAPSVAAAFELSYRRLDDAAARVFRLLSVNPGPDVSTAAATALADLPVAQVRRLLAGLAQAHLGEATPAATGRWRMHDLLRLFAQQLSDKHAEADRRGEAQDRLLGYYLDTAGAANKHLLSVPDVPVSGEFTGWDNALAWFDAERFNLAAAVAMAADTGRDEIAREIPFRLSLYFNWRRLYDDWVAAADISAHAAQRIGGRRRQGQALNNLGLALRNAGRFEEAIAAHRDAAAVFQETSDRQDEASALNNLGVALQKAQHFHRAITAHQGAAAIHRETDNRHGEGMALNNLGLALRNAHRSDEAITVHECAVAIHHETGDRHEEGEALHNLGLAFQDVGRFEEAIAAYQQDITICRETGDRHGEGVTLNNLGLAFQDIERFEEAIAAHQDAAAIFQGTDDPAGEGMALENLERARAGQRA